MIGLTKLKSKKNIGVFKQAIKYIVLMFAFMLSMFVLKANPVKADVDPYNFKITNSNGTYSHSDKVWWNADTDGDVHMMYMYITIDSKTSGTCELGNSDPNDDGINDFRPFSIYVQPANSTTTSITNSGCNFTINYPNGKSSISGRVYMYTNDGCGGWWDGDPCNYNWSITVSDSISPYVVTKNVKYSDPNNNNSVGTKGAGDLRNFTFPTGTLTFEVDYPQDFHSTIEKLGL